MYICIWGVTRIQGNPYFASSKILWYIDTSKTHSRRTGADFTMTSFDDGNDQHPCCKALPLKMLPGLRICQEWLLKYCLVISTLPL